MKKYKLELNRYQFKTLANTVYLGSNSQGLYYKLKDKSERVEPNSTLEIKLTKEEILLILECARLQFKYFTIEDNSRYYINLKWLEEYLLSIIKGE